MTAEAKSAKSILVANDSAAVRYTVVNMVQRTGYRVLEAENGKQTLAVVEAEKPDLIILDIHMPEMGGLEVLQWLRTSDRFKELPVIVLTASADMQDVRRAAVLQISGYLVKSSLSAADIRKRIDEVFEMASLPQIEASQRRVSQCFEVLLADDDEQEQHLLVGLLQKWGCLVEVVPTASDLLSVMATHLPFDIVLISENLADGSGIETAAVAREHEKEAGANRAVIVLLSSRPMEEIWRPAQEAGMDAYLAKPVDPGKLFETLEGMGSVDVAIAEETPRADGDTVFEGEELLERVDADVDLLQRMTALYTRDYGGLLDRLRQAIAAGDGKEFHDATHTLKGMLGNLSAHGGYAIAQELEGLESMEDPALVEDTYSRLKEQAEKVSRSLAAFVTALKKD